MKVVTKELDYKESSRYHFEMYAEYEDDYSCYIYDEDEESCMCTIAELTNEHGSCVYYTGVESEDRTCGEWIGRENYIYN